MAVGRSVGSSYTKVPCGDGVCWRAGWRAG